MRFPLRALVAVVLLATTLTPASASDHDDDLHWTCTYYKWDAAGQRWVMVALLQSEDWYESQPGHQRYESWDCKYCYIPLGLPPRDEDLPPVDLPDRIVLPGGAASVEITGSVNDVIGALAGIVNTGEETAGEAGVTPFGAPPECPRVPPVWDTPFDAHASRRR